VAPSPEASSLSIELVDLDSVRSAEEPDPQALSRSPAPAGGTADRATADRVTDRGIARKDGGHPTWPKREEALEAPGDRRETRIGGRGGSSRHLTWAEALKHRSRAEVKTQDQSNMKFSHSIQFNAVPDWSGYYIAYDNLKKLCVTPVVCPCVPDNADLVARSLLWDISTDRSRFV
jgi:hypothetical protein